MTSAGALILILMVVLILAGIPIAFSIGTASAIYLLVTHLRPLVIVAQRFTLGMESYALLAVPMFLLAGNLMNQGGISKRLVKCLSTVLWWLPGSTGTITIACCAVFAALTGSGPATVAAIGAIMLPSLLDDGYSRSEASGMLASGGALGPIIPPSVCMIVYGCNMGVSIVGMFMGSVVPGLIIAISFITVNIIRRKLKFSSIGVRPEKKRYSFRECMKALLNGLPVLILPVIILGGIYGGVFTPTEAGVVCVFYSFFYGLISRELKFDAIIDALKKTVTSSALVLFILGGSNLLGWILAAAKIPALVAGWLAPIMVNPTIFWIILVLLLLFVGCFIETIANIVILAPLMVPIGINMGIDPLHIACVFCITLVVGMVTPPFGMNLFTATAVCKAQFNEVVKGIWPYLIVVCLLCFLFAFVPELVLWLPNAM